MKFSLVTISERRGDLISGYWVQNFVGTLEAARVKARQNEEANPKWGGKVAVVDKLPDPVPWLSYWRDLKPL